VREHWQSATHLTPRARTVALFGFQVEEALCGKLLEASGAKLAHELLVERLQLAEAGGADEEFRWELLIAKCYRLRDSARKKGGQGDGGGQRGERAPVVCAIDVNVVRDIARRLRRARALREEKAIRGWW
jgi:hypothetical protein